MNRVLISKTEKWTPKLFLCLRRYTVRDFTADLIAGLTVGLVALPLAMAFGIASGVAPQVGIYTAIVAGFLISMFGGSRTQIGGPTGAFVVIVASILARYGMSGLLTVTLMAGFILVLMGVTGLGTAIKFIPRPVTIGFTNGIAVLIASTQIKDSLGLTTPKLPTDFIAKMHTLFTHLGTADWPTIFVTTITLAVILLFPRVTRWLPSSIVAVTLMTIVTVALHLHLATVGSEYGSIPQGLPHVAAPPFRPDLILPLLPSAITVALLAAIESLLSAVVADSMSGDKHNSNVELIAQGIANLACPLIGGIPATGAIARTATNIKAGAKTPVAGMVHALTLLFILLVVAPLAHYIPLATLAAVLFVVAYNMGEWREIGTILRLSNADRGVWIATFVLTIIANLTVAVEVGMLLAALLYIYRVSETTTVSTVTEAYIKDGQPHILQDRHVPFYVSILRIHGPFLFGATEKLLDETRAIDKFAPIVILRLRNMNALDATGLHALETLSDRLRSAGKTLLLCGARDQPAKLLQQGEFMAHVGQANILPHVEAALARAKEIYEGFDGIGQEIARDYTAQDPV